VRSGQRASVPVGHTVSRCPRSSTPPGSGAHSSAGRLLATIGFRAAPEQPGAELLGQFDDRALGGERLRGRLDLAQRQDIAHHVLGSTDQVGEQAGPVGRGHGRISARLVVSSATTSSSGSMPMPGPVGIVTRPSVITIGSVRSWW